MQPTLSNSHISSLMNFWYLSEMGSGFWGIRYLVIGISISNKLVLPTSVDHFDTMESNLCCNSKERLSWGFQLSSAPSSITDCLLWLLGSGWKLDCSSVVGSSLLFCEYWDILSHFLWYFYLNSHFFPWVSPMAAFSISTGCNVPNMVDFGI